MKLWRVAVRDNDNNLSKEEQTELDTLIEEELQASAQQAAVLVDKLQE